MRLTCTLDLCDCYAAKLREAGSITDSHVLALEEDADWIEFATVWANRWGDDGGVERMGERMVCPVCKYVNNIVTSDDAP